MDTAFVFIIGLCIGSFYNVVGIRLLNKESILFSRSQCMSCRHPLGFFDLVPVLSYLCLGGKCRYCQSKISPIYLLGELATGLTLAFLYSMFGFSLEFAIHAVMGSMLVISVVSDLSQKRVSNSVVLVSLVLILVLRLVAWDYFLYYLLSSLGLLFLFILLLIFGGEKIGGGDVKIYTVVGLTLGAWPALLSLFFACVIALGVILPFLVTRSIGWKHQIPFVPFIWGGVLLAYLTNAPILHWIGEW